MITQKRLYYNGLVVLRMTVDEQHKELLDRATLNIDNRMLQLQSAKTAVTWDSNQHMEIISRMLQELVSAGGSFEFRNTRRKQRINAIKRVSKFLSEARSDFLRNPPVTSLDIQICLPDSATDQQLLDAVQDYIGALDELHRAHGKSGLTIDFLEIEEYADGWVPHS